MKSRNGLLLLGGDGLSAFATWIDFLAILTLAAYQFHVSAPQMALVSAAGLLPGMLAAPWIGRFCDRGDPKRLLLASLVARSLATCAILFCHELGPFVALVGLRSLFAAVAPPAINVMAVRCVEAPQRARFYSFLNVLNNTAKVLAPAIGAVSSSLGSEALALVLSLAFSGAAFMAFAGIRVSPATPAVAGDAPAVAAGPTRRPLTPLLWVATTSAFLVFMVNNLVPLVLQRANFDKALLGLLVSCSGAGNVMSGLWLARTSSSRPLRGDLIELVRPALLQAVGFGAIGLVLWARPGAAAAVLCLLFLLIGTLSARYAIALNVHLSTHFHAAIGQVSGVLQSCQHAMILAAPLAGAWVLERWGAPALFGCATASAAASLALLLALQRLGVPTLQAARAAR
jgi:MFS family permease